MQTPQQKRSLIIKEINRILYPEGLFLHPTHERQNDDHPNFREQEEMSWCGGKREGRPYDFGDILISGKTLQEDTSLHIPAQLEVLGCLKKIGLTVIQSFYRSE
ncbi:hypothetical protein ACQKNS_27025 [Peribacillus sp. NPDC094092]|uniref:hypothetical protein n=1 Tax=Peribacillus sp. NPDC094092 TaxID=3390611 RepID=UPI003D0794CD